MEQQETITWHKYPKNNPKEEDNYLVQVVSGHIAIVGYSTRLERFLSSLTVIAWAEMPKGWQE